MEKVWQILFTRGRGWREVLKSINTTITKYCSLAPPCGTIEQYLSNIAPPGTFLSPGKECAPPTIMHRATAVPGWTAVPRLARLDGCTMTVPGWTAVPRLCPGAVIEDNKPHDSSLFLFDIDDRHEFSLNGVLFDGGKWGSSWSTVQASPPPLV